MNLPKPCGKCPLFDGNWIETETGLKRCDCPRGIALGAAAKVLEPETIEPMISTEYATMCTEMMAAMAFFPREAGARGAISDEISAMSATEAKAKWLVKRMIRLYSKWPGVIEMRRVFCSTHVPHDGREAIGESEVYTDGIPSERPTPAPTRLIGGTREDRMISAAPSIEATVRDLVVAKDLNRVWSPVKVREIPIVRITDANRITDADVRKAEDEYRAAKAKGELACDSADQNAGDFERIPAEERRCRATADDNISILRVPGERE